MSADSTLKSSRKTCHEARDLFFACADANSDDHKKCRLEWKNFEKNCPASWVAHFVRKHKFEKYKEDLIKDGYLVKDEGEDAEKRNIVNFSTKPTLRKIYGLSLSEYRHVRIFSSLGLNSDEIPDRFYSAEEIQKAADEIVWNHHSTINAARKLQRHKLAVSLVDFLLTKNLLESRSLKIAITALTEAFIQKAITKEEAKFIKDKIKNQIPNAAKPVQTELYSALAPFEEESTKDEGDQVFFSASDVFLPRAADSIRNRNLKKLEENWSKFPSVVIYGTTVYNDWFEWISDDKVNAHRLMELFMMPIVNNEIYMESDVFQQYFKKTEKIDHLPKWHRVFLNDSECPRCGENFKPKPMLNENEWKNLAPGVDELATVMKLPGTNKLPYVVRKLNNMKIADPLKRPICYIDVANVAYGKNNYLGRARNILTFIGAIYEHFSAIALISKFELPVNLYQQLGQLRTVVHVTKNPMEDVTILQLFTRGTPDGYIVTNDMFRDHCFNFYSMTRSNALQRVIKLRSLRFNDKIIETPSEFSPFAQRTSTGFHLPVRNVVLKTSQAYEYYCFSGLFDRNP